MNEVLRFLQNDIVAPIAGITCGALFLIAVCIIVS